MDLKKYINGGGQLAGVVQRVVTNVNGTKDVPSNYYHIRMLRKVFAPDGNWKSVTANNTQIMAHVVALNSGLPLAKQDAISIDSGKIPKMGLEMALDENQLTDIQNMATQGIEGAVISAQLLSNPKKLVIAVPERNEEIFLKGLSNGFALINDDENTGTGIRLDYGYLTENKFGVAALWSDPMSKPFDDIQRVLDKAEADKNVIVKVMMDRASFNNMSKTTQAKELFAFSQNFVGANTPPASVSQMNVFTSDRYGFEIEIITRSFRYEKNGTQVVVNPWAVGAVVFLTTEEVGTLTWAMLAEMNVANQDKSVDYRVVDQFMLLSSWNQNKPYLAHFDSIQARCVPIINNGNQIYLLNSTTIQA